MWWRGRSERKTKQLTTSGAAAVAQIEADSSERINMVDLLMSRVVSLEQHNDRQDVRIGELVTVNAELRAQNTLLVEQNKLLQRQVTALEIEKATLQEEVVVLREAIQGPISDALEFLDEGGHDET